MTKVFTAFNGFCVKHRINAANISEADLFWLGIYYGEEGMQIHIVDTDGSPYYGLNTQTLKGEAITFGNNITKFYSIGFEEIHRLEESGECTNYGDEAEFKTYADCVAYEQEQIFKPLLGGCMVPWLAAPGSSGICKGRVQLEEHEERAWHDNYHDLYKRVKMSGSSHTDACIKPCLELQAHSTLRTSE